MRGLGIDLRASEFVENVRRSSMTLKNLCIGVGLQFGVRLYGLNPDNSFSKGVPAIHFIRTSITSQCQQKANCPQRLRLSPFTSA